MEQVFDARQTIQYLPEWDGNLLSPWTSVRSYFAYMTCAICGMKNHPKRWKALDSKERVEPEKVFMSRMTCSKSCAKKLKNPMHQQECREKVRQTLIRIGHRPKVRKGNGSGLTVAQACVLSVLGDGWSPEIVVITKKSTKEGYPHHYKVDIANVQLKVAIELDGGSHCSLKRQEQDKKKDALLRTLGWKVLRLKNQEAMNLCSIYGSLVIHHILQMAS